MNSENDKKNSSIPPVTPKPSEGRLETASVHGKSDRSKPKPTPKPTTGKPTTKGK